MKIITTYQCEICGYIYPTEVEAQHCEAKGIIAAKYKVGDVVYLRERYPDILAKPFVQRTIAKVIEAGAHYVRRYVLNEPVKVGESMEVGCEESEGYKRPAVEIDFVQPRFVPIAAIQGYQLIQTNI